MANVVAPFGLRPIRHKNGSPWNGQVDLFLIDSGDATATFVGDLVKIAGASGIAGQVVNGMDVEGIATVNRATAQTTGQDIVGVVVGFLPNPDNLMLKYRVASTSRIALVCTDPTVVYEIQEDADTTPVPSTAVGLNAAYVNTAGSTVRGISLVTLDSSSVATTNTLPLKIVGLSKRVGNAFNTGGAGTDPATFDVMINTGAYLPNIAGV